MHVTRRCDTAANCVNCVALLRLMEKIISRAFLFAVVLYQNQYTTIWTQRLSTILTNVHARSLAHTHTHTALTEIAAARVSSVLWWQTSARSDAHLVRRMRRKLVVRRIIILFQCWTKWRTGWCHSVVVVCRLALIVGPRPRIMRGWSAAKRVDAVRHDRNVHGWNRHDYNVWCCCVALFRMDIDTVWNVERTFA